MIKLPILKQNTDNNNTNTNLQREVKIQQFLSDKNNIIKIFVISFLFVISICILLFISNKNIQLKDIEHNTEANNNLPNTEVYASDPNSPVRDGKPTELERLGIREKMFIGKQGEYICSNCARKLEAEDTLYYMVVAERESFIRMYFCDNCFVPVGELLSSIGL